LTKGLDFQQVDDEVHRSNKEINQVQKEVSDLDLKEKYKEATDKSEELQRQSLEEISRLQKEVSDLKEKYKEATDKSKELQMQNRRLQRKFDRTSEELQNKKSLDQATKLRQLKELGEKQLEDLAALSGDIKALLSQQTAASKSDSDMPG
jgi:chromosome segregation ATPase